MRFHDCCAEWERRRRVGEELFYAIASCGFPEDSDFGGIAAEFGDVGLDPLEREADVEVC